MGDGGNYGSFSRLLRHGYKKTDAMLASVASPRFAEPGKLLGSFRGDGCRSVREAPADFVALGGGAQFALLAFSRGLKCTAAAHFFEDTLGIQFGLKAFESTVNGLTFFHSHSTHAMILGWFGLVPQFLRGAVNAPSACPCQDRTHWDFENNASGAAEMQACAVPESAILVDVLPLSACNYADRSVKHPAVGALNIL
jgi:hypothetical protein